MPVRPARWLVLASALAGIAGCYRRVEQPLAASSGTVACFGDDHLVRESGFSVTGRKYCVAACRRFGYTPVAAVTDEGGITPRLNPGLPPSCL